MRDMMFRLLMVMVMVLVAAATASRADDAKPQTSQWVLVVVRPSFVWTPGVYGSAERCRVAQRAFSVSTGLSAKCAELLSP